jgi:integrase
VADVRAYTSSRHAEGAANGTINRELAALKRMFNLTFEGERMNRKPYIPMLPESPPRKGFFDAEQFARVLAALSGYLRPVAEFGYYTGWRRSEITSLRWDQVDLNERSIRLWTGTTKNGNGRFLPLAGELWRVIEEQRKTPVVGCPYVSDYGSQDDGDFRSVQHRDGERASRGSPREGHLCRKECDRSVPRGENGGSSGIDLSWTTCRKISRIAVVGV